MAELVLDRDIIAHLDESAVSIRVEGGKATRKNTSYKDELRLITPDSEKPIISIELGSLDKLDLLSYLLENLIAETDSRQKYDPKELIAFIRNNIKR